MSDDVHVMPVDDLIEHEFQDCACMPDVELTEHNVWLYSHHSLDGRELNEAR